MQAEVFEEDPWGGLIAGGSSTANDDAYQVVPSSASPPCSADQMDDNRQREESIEAQSRRVYACVVYGFVGKCNASAIGAIVAGFVTRERAWRPTRCRRHTDSHIVMYFLSQKAKSRFDSSSAIERTGASAQCTSTHKSNLGPF